MRRVLLGILTFLITACGQDNPTTPKPTDSHTSVLQSYGGNEDDEGFSAIATSDGGYAIAGSFRSTDGDFIGLNRGAYDIFLMKFDAEGGMQWNKTFGGSESDFAFSVIQSFDEGFIITGSTSSFDGDFEGLNKGNLDIFIFKLDNNGEIQWIETYGGNSPDGSLSIIQTSDGGYAITGYFRSDDGDFEGLPSYNDLDVFILKIKGNKQWLKTFGGDNDEISVSIAETTDGSFVITGHTTSQDGNFDRCELRCLEDIYVIKVDADGSLIWSKRFGGSLADLGRTIITSNDGVLVTGMSASNDGEFAGLNKGSEDIFALKVDFNGALQWVKTFGGSNTDDAFSIIKTNDSGYILTGYTTSNDGDFNELNKGGSDIFAMKIDLNGNIQWVDTFGGTRGESARSIAQTSNGEYVLTGGFGSNDGYFEGHNLRGEDVFDDIFIIELETYEDIN